MSSPVGLSIDQVVDWHRINTPQDVYAVFSDADGSQTNVTWSTFGNKIHGCVGLVKNAIIECTTGKPSDEPIVIGMLANSDTLTYFTMLYAHLRFTHPNEGGPILPFLISPQNSAIAIAHLLRAANVKYLWVSNGPARELAEKSLTLGDHDETVHLLDFPSYNEVYETNHAYKRASIPQVYYNTSLYLDSPALILHSSGTTGFPKPITITHQNACRHYRIFVDSTEATAKGERVAIHPFPVYTMLGYLSSLWSAASGVILAIRSPRATLKPLTPELFLQSIVNDNCSIIYTVPDYLEAWSLDSKSIETLQTMKYIYWSGGPLSRRVGEMLYKQNVPICQCYGATEFGAVMIAPKKPIPEGFEWFRFAHGVIPVCLPIDSENKLYKLCLKQTDDIGLAVINTEIDGCPAYDTNDIVEKHPLDPTLFHIVGRYDDLIILQTGRKTDPVPLVKTMELDKNIKSAIMFGRGRPFNGVLIQPSSFDELRRLGTEGFINEIWPTIQVANTTAPPHSRIFKEMIILASPSKPFVFADKGTVRKGPTLKLYDAEIENTYKNVEESVKTDIPIPQGSHPDGGWTDEESLSFVRSVVRSIMEQTKNIRDTDDLFSLGCDSLQATFMKNTLFYALRQVTTSVRNPPENFIYQFPTIQGLSQYLAKMSRAETSDESSDPGTERRERLESYVHRFTQNWPVHQPRLTAKDEVVLLTGSTGGLGSQLLAQLVQIPSVSCIYAFNRKSSKSLYERHLEEFKDRGNDVNLLDSPKIVFIVGDTSEPGFGIDGELFREMQETVTTIIHNAWQVNFNITLASFEPALRGVRNLVDFALNSPLLSPPALLFTSTVGIVKGWAGVSHIPETPITDIEMINQSGYGESKWVSERILTIAEENTPLKSVIVRVGQLSGGINGNWNPREWFPALVQASQVVRGLPDNEGLTSFVPLHIAASAIIELRSAPINVAHIVHPRPTPWKVLINYVSEILSLPLIPYEEWLTRLEKSPRTDSTLQTNPALYLYDFYRSALSHGDAERMAMYDTSRTTLIIHSLDEEHLPQLSKDEVRIWIGYWRAKGVLK